MAKLDINQVRWVVGVSTATRIDPRVLIAWMQQEGANAKGGTGHFNYLNLRPLAGDPYSGISGGNFEQFSNVNDSIKATVKRLNQPFAKPIVATAQTKPSPKAQIAAIASTAWDTGHYGGAGGPNLVNTFNGLFKGGLNDSYLDPANARAVGNTVSTGSATIGKDPIGSTPSVIDAATGAITAPFSGIADFFRWIGGNWDRIGWVALGSIFAILGLVFLAKKQTAAPAPNPVTAKSMARFK